MRTHQAPSECGQEGGTGCGPGGPGQAQSHLRASQAVQVGIQWTKGLRVAQFPYCDSLQTMVSAPPSIRQREGGLGLGMLFCFLLLVKASHHLLCSN